MTLLIHFSLGINYGIGFYSGYWNRFIRFYYSEFTYYTTLSDFWMYIHLLILNHPVKRSLSWLIVSIPFPIFTSLNPTSRPSFFRTAYNLFFRASDCLGCSRHWVFFSFRTLSTVILRFFIMKVISIFS